MSVFRDTVFTARASQKILDAASRLQVERSAVAARLADGDLPDARVVARGCDAINEWIPRAAKGWRELRSTLLRASTGGLGVSLPNNRALIADGLRMTSIVDFHRAEPAARLMLAAETAGTYLFSYAPLQMKIVDGTHVLLDGPPHAEDSTLMMVSSPVVLAAATAYWDALVEAAFPCAQIASDGSGLTARQRRIAAMLGADLRDDQIAAELGVSVRTVRYDVGRLMEQLGTRSRFAAGLQLARIADTTR